MLKKIIYSTLLCFASIALSPNAFAHKVVVTLDASSLAAYYPGFKANLECIDCGWNGSSKNVNVTGNAISRGKLHFSRHKLHILLKIPSKNVVRDTSCKALGFYNDSHYFITHHFRTAVVNHYNLHYHKNYHYTFTLRPGNNHSLKLYCQRQRIS